MGKNVKQITAKNIREVMWWVETTPHHKADSSDPKFFIISGPTNILRIPTAICKQCFLKPGGDFDSRMYRWDHEAERDAANKSSQENKEAFFKKLREPKEARKPIKASVPEIKPDPYLEGIRNR